jgi:hypothetical protein
MFAKAAFGLALVLAASSGALAATTTPRVAPGHDLRSADNTTNTCARWFSWPCGLGTQVFELNPDWAHGHY